ncbi:tagaturonate reductase [Chitinophaga terrae (ex Kim and Jung 2007)]|uniref:Tagaturonate reductase n=1 Tax=Chitinophaga terrae (ex Kim and Jung 2007) TaxID=408074 RepID=A0A1H4DG91_9BACT|nr:tagaturonate reductase [Chitinophaga terrae (ex Kim and Jung 2007)]GEP92708.1 mannitol dehydrogenase [Chitinophaga terrae (ex Kim and Jung 2007)]SEA71853.1 tagaturonate reductase [Chitinophaga terrae (ex Kim and Jung 2007)]
MLPILNSAYIQRSTDSNVNKDVFSYPETILQFGTGVLLRGLVDYLVDKGNRNGSYKGRIVVIKSTDGSTSEFSEQDNLFTTHIKGVAQGELVDNVLINSSISRVLQSNAEWEKILEAVHQPALQTIISNTTEVGIQYVPERIKEGVPASFPGKLLALLWERYHYFKGSSNTGFVIVPTELVVDNGRLLKEIVLQLAAYNELPQGFTDWIHKENRFCNSLVDRIVPGKPRNLAEMEEKAGYRDQLWIEVEPFLLWAIEGDEQVKSVLSFHQADERMLIAESITPYREQKLRILNGSHTVSVPLAFLSGLNTVYESMKDPFMNRFFKKVILEEILPTIENECPTAPAFAQDVLDRFANPFIEHKLISITFQESSKMNARNVKTFQRYHEKFNKVPPYMSLGFAAMILFLRPAGRKEDGKYYGNREAGEYVITDDNAAIFAEYWQNATDIHTLVSKIAADKRLWETDLTAIPGFVAEVTSCLSELKEKGVAAFIQSQLELK